MTARATGPAWALADALTVGCGGVATVPRTTSAEDVARLVALGVAVVVSAWVTVATWRETACGTASGCAKEL